MADPDAELPVPPPAARPAPDRARRSHAALWLAACLLAVPWGVPARAACADLALVLAADASGSVASRDFVLQQQGYARAFRSARLQAALAAAGIVDVGLILRGDTDMTPQFLPMAPIRDAGDALALADRIEAMPRRVSGNTGIGRALSTALDMLEDPGACALRRLVNPSGDGLETIVPRARSHVALAEARRRAEALGITVKALAIRTDVPDLDQWCRDRLILGAGTFVLEVPD